MTRIESDGSDDLGEISVEVEDNLDAYHTNGSLDEEYTDNIVETANHGNGDDGDEYLYGGLDDLKKMISEESSGVDDDYLDEGADYELLAEFSDVDDASEDDEANFMDAVREANNFKSARRKRKKEYDKKTGKQIRRRREKPLDPEVAQLLSEANEAFVRNDLLVAERLYNDVIKKDPRNFAAYQTLGDIYQIQGRLNDCCNTWFLAAHIHSSDWRFWKMVALLSADLHHTRQAIYCFTRVITINREEWESLYRRAILYRDIGQLGKSIDGFQRLHRNNPYDANILRELAVLFVDHDRVKDAIDLYTELFDTNVKRRVRIETAMETAVDSSDEENESSDDDDDKQLPEEYVEEMLAYPNLPWKRINKEFSCIPFDWSCLNILAELYLKSKLDGDVGITMIKSCARWIQHRESERFWEDVHDDSEFDERRSKNVRYKSLPESEKNKEFTLPIDIRVRLGLLRLKVSALDEALNHFQFLGDENFVDVADLYFEVGRGLTKHEDYKEALDYFIPLLSLEDYDTAELYENVGKCYKETEKYEEAQDFYEKAVELQPDNLNNKLELAEVHYHMGDIATFKMLLDEVLETRKEREEALYGGINKVSDAIGRSERPKPIPVGKPVLDDSKYRKFSDKRKRTLEEIERDKIERERKITLKVLDKYNSLKKYEDGMKLGDKKAVDSWVNAVFDLVDVFSSVKNFFVKSRSKKFVGIIRKTKRFNTALEYQIERLTRLSEGGDLSNVVPVIEERVMLTSATELRGLTYDQWFELFMNLALTLTRSDKIDDALGVLDTAFEVNVFRQDPNRAKLMRFIRLAILLQSDDEEQIMESLRNSLNQYQFNRRILQLFMYVLSHGRAASDLLTRSVQQKFFLRQIKAFDSSRFNTFVSGQASITNKDVVNPKKKPSPYLYFLYSILLYSSRGYLSALQYLAVIENELPDDPMLNLLSGLSHMHRSMQRLTPNRHFEFLHSLRYLFRYHDIRSSKYTELERQEADYNIGRAFHFMGLVTIALTYYKKVLDDYEDETLKKHAAYNSVVIYQQSGNIRLAHDIMVQYLTV